MSGKSAKRRIKTTTITTILLLNASERHVERKFKKNKNESTLHTEHQ